MKSKELQADLTKKQKRLDELTGDLEAARAVRDDAQKSLIDGRKGASEAATTATAAVLSLESATEALQAQIESLQAKLDEVLQAENRVATVDKLVNLAGQAVEDRARYETAFKRLAASIKEGATEIGNAKHAWRETHNSFLKSFAEIAPGILTKNTSSTRLEKAVIDSRIAERDRLLDELEERGIDYPAVVNSALIRDFYVDALPSYHRPETAYGDVIDAAMNITNNGG